MVDGGEGCAGLGCAALSAQSQARQASEAGSAVCALQLGREGNDWCGGGLNFAGLSRLIGHSPPLLVPAVAYPDNVKVAGRSLDWRISSGF